jgi:hypothetical protein
MAGPAEARRLARPPALGDIDAMKCEHIIAGSTFPESDVAFARLAVPFQPAIPVAPAIARPKPRWQPWAVLALVLMICGNLAYFVGSKHAGPGCAVYEPVSGPMLIAHAGGGLPGRIYPNSIEALDRSYARGLRTFEMDFHELPFGLIRSGHDTSDLYDPRGAWISDVYAWLRAHPDARLIVDMKTDNVSGLKIIAAGAPDLRSRIVPFVYSQQQYGAVAALGLARPIYALFSDVAPDWVSFANHHDFAAVAMSSDRFASIPEVKVPVIAYTLDTLPEVPGLSGVITNCMMPAR